MNNPVMFVDPDGREIWIHYENKEGKSEKVEYSAGMKYEGSNTFVATTIKFLNAVNTNKSGAQVISSLSSSKNSFDFTNTPSSAGDRSFQLEFEGNKNYNEGGAQIHSSAILDSNIMEYQKVDSFAHELFHSYQRENGQDPASINGEVGAYLFGRGVAGNCEIPSLGMASFGNQSEEGKTYDISMTNLLFGWGDNQQNEYNNAINNFSKGASVNKNGLYKNHKIAPNYKPLILEFTPFFE